jgi:hypothetical protein
MHQIHDAMRISTSLKPREEAIVDNDKDILAVIVLAHSVDEARAYETDEEKF